MAREISSLPCLVDPLKQVNGYNEIYVFVSISQLACILQFILLYYNFIIFVHNSLGKFMMKPIIFIRKTNIVLTINLRLCNKISIFKIST